METKIIKLDLTPEQIRNLPTTPVEICKVEKESIVELDPLTMEVSITPVDNPLDAEFISER